MHVHVHTHAHGCVYTLTIQNDKVQNPRHFVYTCTCIAHARITIRTLYMYVLQVNEKSFDLKEGIYGWYKKEGDKTGMDGWMDGCCHGDNRILLINRHKPYLLP